jgi:xylulokinase
VSARAGAREVVLGVDSSTQSSTVELRDVETGELVATGRAPHPVTTPPVSEQHPDAWWDALATATRDATGAAEAAGRRVRVVGVSVGAQCHGLVATDEHGAVVRPAKLWNDTTSGAEAAALLERRDAAWWARELGVVPSAALTISKLAWLAAHEPEALARTRRLSVPHDWITTRLTGRHVTDRSDASGTGYWSAGAEHGTGAWRTDLLDELVGPRDWASMLPTVLGADEAAGTVTAEAAAVLGIDAGAVVGAGGGDQHLAAQGIGLREGDVAYSLGTSGVVFATSRTAVHDETGAIDGVANTTGGWLPLVCTLNAAKVTDAAARLLGVGHDELAALALAAPATPGRPVMAAYLDGERSPRLPWARGMLSGIGSDVTREQFALAAFEGVVLGLERGARRIAEFGVPADGRTILIGGGAKSPAYRRIVADLSRRPALTVDAAEATARGAAIQAAAVVRGERVADVTERWAPAVLTTTEPELDRSDVLERYERLADLQADGSTF